jgi:hypothetical protein
VSESPSEGQQHADSEPVSERLSDWRDDGSAPRFTEPPHKPPTERPGERNSEQRGERQTGRPSERRGDRSGERRGDNRQGTSSRDRAGGRQGGKQAADPVGDMQRWLMKAGARTMANQVADNVRRSLGQQKSKRDKGDVWDTATTEPPQDEPPECQWCPVCQAARRIRESGPGIGDRLMNVGGVFASVVQDAFSVVEQTMKTPPPDDSQQDKAS